MKAKIYSFVLLMAMCTSLTCNACTRISGKTEEKTKNEQQKGIVTKATDENNDATYPQQSEIVSTATTVNIFVENSGSMNGYINNSSNFQVALGDQIVKLKNYYGFENIHLYYINDGVYAQEYNGDSDGLIDFAQNMLNPQQFKSVGSTGSTELNDIIKKALEYVDNTSISIIVSDCIYSISGNGTSGTLLGISKNKTKDKFLYKSQNIESLATSIIQLTSNFDGNYWEYKHPNSNPIGLNCERPYYLCVLGTHENVMNYVKNIDVTKMEGFKHQYTISNLDVSQIRASIMNRYGKIGNYRLVGGNNCYCTMENVSPRNGELRLVVGVDMSLLTMSSTDKIDVSNFSIIGNYMIDYIEEIDTILVNDPKDKLIVRYNGLTHFIHLRTSNFPGDFSISIKRKTPSWVYESNSLDDTQIASDTCEQKKTFGLSYFVDGISEAYMEMANDKDNFIILKFNTR